MLSEQVYDVIDTTSQRLEAAGGVNAEDVRALPAMVGFSDSMKSASNTLKSFLHKNLYRHPQVMDNTNRARQVVTDLFALYLQRPEEMTDGALPEQSLARAVADHIAGMTDRFAIREHERLMGTSVFPSGIEAANKPTPSVDVR